MTLHFIYPKQFSHSTWTLKLMIIRFTTLVHENPVTRECCFIDSDLNFSIFHSASVSPTNGKLETLYKQ